ncbi:MAG: copper chaperone PCu(A)C [Tepidimonas sp.]|uniref:copper chaperone PCu(A)C n=1 Tax=Tepidimonas sp. TaxID=2002775 RepID=UPI004054D538
MKPMTSSIIGLALATVVTAAAAQNVKIEDPWVRGTVAQQKATGAFMRLTAPERMRLVGAESPVAGVVEVHEMAMVDNVMKMRQIPGLELPAGQPVELKPGGYHIMLMNLRAPVQPGEQVPLKLIFENASGQRVTQEVQARVKAIGAGPGNMQPAGSMGGHHGHGHQH